MNPPRNPHESGYFQRGGIPFVTEHRGHPVRKTLWAIGWLLWLLITINLMQEWAHHTNNSAGAFVLIVFWSVFTGAFILAPWFSKRTADGLTQFSAPPLRRRDPKSGMLLQRTERGTLWRPGEVQPSYFETHPPPLDWSSIVSACSSALREILPAGIEVRAEKVSLVLTSGDARRTVHLGSMFASPPQDEAPRVLRGCTKMLAETQSFVVELRHEAWPLRPGPTAGTLAHPVALIVNGQLVLEYGDSLGPVAVLQPIALPGDLASID